jgi:hypothetical protein
MKRLFWVFLAAWCTAFAQVQPVVVVPPETMADCCCGADCGCGPTCPMLATLPAPAPVAETTEKPGQSRLSRQAAPETASTRTALPPLSFASPAQAGMADDRPPADAVPRFCRHCAFLI